MWYTLALLACPVSMGLMMVMMMRGRHTPAAPVAPPFEVAEIAALRAEVEALKAERAQVSRPDPVNPPVGSARPGSARSSSPGKG